MFFNFFTSLLFLSKPLLIVLLFSKEKYQKTKEFLQRSFQTIKIYTISLLELIIQITDKASASLFYFLQAFHIIKFIFWPFLANVQRFFSYQKTSFCRNTDLSDSSEPSSGGEALQSDQNLIALMEMCAKMFDYYQGVRVINRVIGRTRPASSEPWNGGEA